MFYLRRHQRVLLLAAIFALAALIYATAGFHNTLQRDSGGYLYAGQQVLKGIPPYVSIFSHKGPLAPLIVAAGVALAGPLGVPDVHSVRLLFCLLSCLTVVVLYLLAERVSASRRVALLAVVTFLGFYPFTLGATAGPDAKVPMLLFLLLGLYLTTERRWLWAGLCGGLSALTWQPALVFSALTLLLACLQPRPQRTRAVLLVLVGGIVPVLVVVAYFAERRALFELVDRAILFNLFSLQRVPRSALERVLAPIQVIRRTYGTMVVPIAIGFVMFLSVYPSRVLTYRRMRDAIQDPFIPLLVTFPLPIIWSIKDFQGPADFFIFLPYVSLGFGLLIDSALRHVAEHSRPAWLPHALLAGICLTLMFFTGLSNRAERNPGLNQQQRAAAKIVARFGPDARVVAIELPQVLALTHTTSPTPYMNLLHIIDVQEQYLPGGFAGWLQTIQTYNPQIVAVGRLEGRHAAEFQAWLDAGYAPETIGPWKVYVRR